MKVQRPFDVGLRVYLIAGLIITIDLALVAWLVIGYDLIAR